MSSRLKPNKLQHIFFIKSTYTNIYEGDLSNDSFTHWNVGVEQEIHEDDNYRQRQRKVVDDWFLENFKEGESVLVLYWW